MEFWLGPSNMTLGVSSAPLLVSSMTQYLEQVVVEERQQFFIKRLATPGCMEENACNYDPEALWSDARAIWFRATV